MYVYMFIYTVEPPYFELIGIKPKLSWLKTCPLFRDKHLLLRDMLNEVDVILLSSCTPTFYYEK